MQASSGTVYPRDHTVIDTADHRLSIGTIRVASSNRPTGRPGGFRSSGERPLSALAELTGILGGAILCGMTGLAPELARLSPRERLDLIESLWESLDEKDVPVTDAQRAALDRRIVGFDQDGQKAFRGISLGPSSDNGAERAVGRRDRARDRLFPQQP